MKRSLLLSLSYGAFKFSLLVAAMLAAHYVPIIMSLSWKVPDPYREVASRLVGV